MRIQLAWPRRYRRCTKCTVRAVDDDRKKKIGEARCEGGVSSTCHRHYHQETRGDAGFESNSCLRLQSALVARVEHARPLTDSPCHALRWNRPLPWRDRERSSPGRKICRVTSGSLCAARADEAVISEN